MRMFKNCKEGLGGDYKETLEYELNGEALTIRPVERDNMIKLRELDSWGLAVYKNLSAKQEKIEQLIFEINPKDYKKEEIESLKRRLSFLNQNNSFIISFYQDGKEVNLYSYEDFAKISSEEIIDSNLNPRKKYEYEGKLEKDIQKFLSDSISSKIERYRTNKRLAIFGSHFTKKESVLIREFPTGTYRDKKSEANRITPTYFIDFVTVNDNGILSLVELKINNNTLDVISQALDYSLFFLIHKESIKNILEKAKIKYKEDSVPFNTYIANNSFHPKFDEIFEFYNPKETEKYFELIKTTMGYYG